MSQKGKIRKILLLIGGLGLCAGGAVLGSGIFVKSFIQTQIRLSGFPDAHIETLAFTPSGLVIDHISLDGHDFSTVDQVSASFDWGDLIFNRHVETLSVKDITLMAEIEDGGTFRLAGWDTTLPKSSSEDNKFPFDTLLLQGITLDLDTPEGNFRVQGKAHIEAKSDNSQSINFSVWSEQKLLSFALDGTGRISPDGNFSVDFNLPEARLELSDFQATRLSGSGKYNAPANGAAFASGQVLAGSIKTANVLLQDVALLFDSTKVEPFYFKTSPAGYPDIDIIGRWNRTPPEQFELSIEAKQGEDILSLFQKEPDRMTKDWMSRLNPLTVQFALPKDVFDQDAKTAAWAIQAGSVSPLKISGTARYDSNSFKLSFVPTQIDASLISDYFPFKDKFGVKFSDGTIGLQGKFMLPCLLRKIQSLMGLFSLHLLIFRVT
ncbi:MAG TPA: hypothetical protein PLK94_03005 [Alphaproteobacteria bacterium]|nr:hypothetical protein [Alphaproteobacteria bacterium]